MRVKIKEICEINPKQEVLDDESIISFVGMAQISNDNKFDTSILKKYKDVKKGFSSFKNGDILFAKITPCMENGKGVLIENLYNETGFGSTEFHVLRVNLEIVSKKYLYWFTKWKTFRLNCEKNMTGSAGQKRVPKNYIENYELNLPKLFVQEKRVKILDCLLEIKQKKLQKLVELENLSKCLFVEMFGDPILNEKNWSKKSYEEMSTLITDGEHQTPKRIERGIYLLSARNIYNHHLKLEDVDYITEEEYIRISKRIVPKENDILISCSGSIGRVCLVPKNLKFQLVRSVALIRVKENINPIFMEYLIASDFTQNQIKKETTKSSQANLFQGKIKKLVGIIPPIELQNKFAERIKLIEKSKFIIGKNFKSFLSIQNYLFYLS